MRRKSLPPRLTETRSDADLVRAISTGSTDAAEMLLERHWRTAWSAAYAVTGNRASADDAAQAAVEKAFRRLDSYDSTRPFGPWFARVAVNEALNAQRPVRREQELHEEIAASDPFGDVLERDELIRAVAELPSDRRIVVALRYWADLDPREIAEALDLPVGTVSSRLARALGDLRAAFQEVETRD